jgi:hypothetical protein
MFSSCKKDEIIDDDNNNQATDAKTEWTKPLALPINPALGKNYMPAVDGNDNIYVLMRNFEGDGYGYAMQKFDKKATSCGLSKALKPATHRTTKCQHIFRINCFLPQIKKLLL